MNSQSAINKEIFIPRDERLLVSVEVWRRKRKKMSFLPPGAKGDYATFICVSVSNTIPHQLFITKVKQFGGSSSFVRRSQWTVEQLRQVNGINASKDSPEFDLVFDNAFDQWVARSSAEKCIFIQILYHACQTYWEGKAGNLGKPAKLMKVGQQGRATQYAHPEVGAGPSNSSASRTTKARRKSYVPPRETEFINCQSKLTGDACTMNLVIYRCKVFLNRMKNMIVANQNRSPGQVKATVKGTLKSGQTRQRVTGGTLGNVAKRVNVTLGQRGDRLTQAEDKTVELMHKAQQFADTAHKLALKYSK
ncbi:syntaxin binding protein 6 (amisyn), like isoform X1 [Amphiprion ocellaris]|uniref:Exocyst complex component Sec3 PIP2-binding N-terminal domain-containing protein n=1 Tax=Amphiprion ocellaris TaxID=80972 RepID=A0A3Q1CNK3_AMPOC|nr:syntaxin binding protein 6 (amisyn), like isoform X1 [Amphiprion ocellaris]